MANGDDLLEFVVCRMTDVGNILINQETCQKTLCNLSYALKLKKEHQHHLPKKKRVVNSKLVFWTW